jgi:heat shock protein HspQ
MHEREEQDIPFHSFLSRNTEHTERKKKRGQKNLEQDNTGRKLRAPSQIEINHSPIAPTDRDGIVFVFLLMCRDYGSNLRRN